MKKIFIVLSFLCFVLFTNMNTYSAINYQADAQWDAQFDEIRMTRKDSLGNYQDIMTFKFGNYWPPYPFTVDLNKGDIVIFPKIKGPNTGAPVGVIWDTDWVGELWTSNKDDVTAQGKLVATFNKDTESILIPKEFIFPNTQAIVRLMGKGDGGEENILYDQFFFTLSTINNINTEVEGGGEGTVIIQVPCYITNLSEDNFVVDSSDIELQITTTTSKVDCGWNISTTDSWIILPDQKSYTGSSTFAFTVTENTDEQFRVGTIKIDNMNVTVVQKAKTMVVQEVCEIGFKNSNNSYDYAIFENDPSESFIEVRTSKEDCVWRASTNVDWIELSSLENITGNSNLSFSVSLNDSQEARFGIIEIIPVVNDENSPAPEKKIFAVAQRGKFVPIVEVPCYVTETVPSHIVTDHTAKTENNSILLEVFLNQQCNISVDPQNEWIKISQKTITENDENIVEIDSGSGYVVYNTAKLHFELEENKERETRIGTIKVGNHFFIVVQTGVPDPIFVKSISPSYAEFTSSSQLRTSGEGNSMNGSYIGVGSPLTELVDDQGMKWEIIDGIVKVNGENAGFTQNVVLLLWWDGKIYQSNQAGGWWRWDGNGVWFPMPEGDPRPDANTGTYEIFLNKDMFSNLTQEMIDNLPNGNVTSQIKVFTTNSPWINVTEYSYNKSELKLTAKFTVQENTTNDLRVGFIRALGDPGPDFLVIQNSPLIAAPVECRILSVQDEKQNSFSVFDGKENQGTISVTCNLETCDWRVTTTSDWILILGDEDRSGSRNISYSLKENNTNNTRIGTIKILDRDFIVIQSAKAPTITILFNGELQVINPQQIPMNSTIVID